MIRPPALIIRRCCWARTQRVKGRDRSTLPSTPACDDRQRIADIASAVTLPARWRMRFRPTVGDANEVPGTTRADTRPSAHNRKMLHSRAERQVRRQLRELGESPTATHAERARRACHRPRARRQPSVGSDRYAGGRQHPTLALTKKKPVGGHGDERTARDESRNTPSGARRSPLCVRAGWPARRPDRGSPPPRLPSAQDRLGSRPLVRPTPAWRSTSPSGPDVCCGASSAHTQRTSTVAQNTEHAPPLPHHATMTLGGKCSLGPTPRAQRNPLEHVLTGATRADECATTPTGMAVGCDINIRSCTTTAWSSPTGTDF